MGKFCQIFKMSNIWANRRVLFPKVKVLIFLIVFNSKQGSCRSNLNSEKQFCETEGLSMTLTEMALKISSLLRYFASGRLNTFSTGEGGSPLPYPPSVTFLPLKQTKPNVMWDSSFQEEAKLRFPKILDKS